MKFEIFCFMFNEFQRIREKMKQTLTFSKQILSDL